MTADLDPNEAYLSNEELDEWWDGDDIETKDTSSLQGCQTTPKENEVASDRNEVQGKKRALPITKALVPKRTTKKAQITTQKSTSRKVQAKTKKGGSPDRSVTRTKGPPKRTYILTGRFRTGSVPKRTSKRTAFRTYRAKKPKEEVIFEEIEEVKFPDSSRTAKPPPPTRKPGDPLRICATQPTLSSTSWDHCKKLEKSHPDDFVCVEGRNQVMCAWMLKKNHVDIGRMDMHSLYVAGKYFNGVPLSAIRVEGKLHRTGTACLIRKDSTITSIRDLKGRGAFMGPPGNIMNFLLPVHCLMSMHLLPFPQKKHKYRLVEEYFGNVCAAGSWSTDPFVNNQLKAVYSNLCSLCGDPKSCSENDKYAGAKGIVEGVIDGIAGVGFTDYEELKLLIEIDKTLLEKLQLLCLDGHRSPLTNQSCLWAVEPASAYVTSSKNRNAAMTVYLKKLQITEGYTELDTYYEEHPYLGEIWWNNGSKPSTSKLRDYRLYLGHVFVTMDRTRHCDPDFPYINFCCVSEEEMQQCWIWSKAAESWGLTPYLRCIQRPDKVHCKRAVLQNDAHVVVLDAGDLYWAWKNLRLMPAVAEVFPHTGTNNYAVAIVRKSNPAQKLADLKGMRSCHSGMDTAAGWMMPVQSLIYAGVLTAKDCGIVAQVADFFSGGSCVPGANSKHYNKNLIASARLCQLCEGQEGTNGKFKCYRDSKEKYRGDDGALRCLAEYKADVAFVKHLAIQLYITGPKINVPKWSQGLKADDFKLLCVNGSAPIDDFRQCNLGVLPSNFAMIKGDHNIRERLTISSFLAFSSDKLGGVDIKGELIEAENVYNIFDTTNLSESDMLFSDGAIALNASAYSTYSAMGHDFYDASVMASPDECLDYVNY